MELSEKIMNNLTNIKDLNILSEEIFVQVLEAVIFNLGKTPVDSKAARHDVDKESLEKFLNTASIVSHRTDKLCYSYANNKQEIQMQLQLIGNNLPHIVDTDWRLSHSIKYGFQSSIGSFQYHVRFTTKEHAEIKYVTFTCTLQQLQELLCKIKDAIRHLEKIPSN
uniref:COMM domain-containing protein 3 isoform X2 n=1 Tax=Vespula vulgaris TaxID=7454 RepID=UPI00223AF664|nr:COMM domain-containing protein 3 isoform X2 [Vespula vulgaris]